LDASLLEEMMAFTGLSGPVRLEIELPAALSTSRFRSFAGCNSPGADWNPTVRECTLRTAALSPVFEGWCGLKCEVVIKRRVLFLSFTGLSGPVWIEITNL